VLHALIGATDREHFAVVYLDARHGIIGVSVEHVGGQSQIGTIDPRCVFRGAILARASSLILGHNHPAGDPAPSEEDVTCTRSLALAAHTLGLPIVDHVIVTRDPDRWASMRDMGMIG
jgi:DNA repair protein RadC